MIKNLISFLVILTASFSGIVFADSYILQPAEGGLETDTVTVLNPDTTSQYTQMSVGTTINTWAINCNNVSPNKTVGVKLTRLIDVSFPGTAQHSGSTVTYPPGAEPKSYTIMCTVKFSDSVIADQSQINSKIAGAIAAFKDSAKEAVKNLNFQDISLISFPSGMTSDCKNPDLNFETWCQELIPPKNPSPPPTGVSNNGGEVKFRFTGKNPTRAALKKPGRFAYTFAFTCPDGKTSGNYSFVLVTTAKTLKNKNWPRLLNLLASQPYNPIAHDASDVNSTATSMNFSFQNVKMSPAKGANTLVQVKRAILTYCSATGIGG